MTTSVCNKCIRHNLLIEGILSRRHLWWYFACTSAKEIGGNLAKNILSEALSCTCFKMHTSWTEVVAFYYFANRWRWKKSPQCAFKSILFLFYFLDENNLTPHWVSQPMIWYLEFLSERATFKQWLNHKYCTSKTKGKQAAVFAHTVYILANTVNVGVWSLRSTLR